MSKLLRRMTGKSSEMKKRALSLNDDELEEMYQVKKMPDDARKKMSSLLALLKTIRQCNKAKNITEAVRIIIEAVCKILNCDRATVFIVDEVRHELVIKEAVGADDIRIPWDVGIAGTVYQTNRKLNIPNAYKDDRFNKETDKATGYKTSSLLTLPIVNENGDTVAVLQAVNKKDGEKKFKPFTEEDELLSEHMALQVGIILSNHLLTEKTKRSHAQVISLLQIVRSLHSNMGINSLMFTITERSPSLVDADRCTLYLVDRSRNELWSLQGAVEIRVPMSKGLAGACATSGKVINIEDAHKDDRFNKAYDLKHGYRTRSVLVSPIMDDPVDGSKRSVVGVLQMINKLHGGKFDKSDEELLSSFLDIAGSILVTSQLFNSAQKKLSEFGATKDILHPSMLNKNKDKTIRPKSMKDKKDKNRVKSLRSAKGRQSGVSMTIKEEGDDTILEE